MYFTKYKKKKEKKYKWACVALALVASVQRSEEFHSGTGRDGIEVQSRDPGIFRDGISLIFQSRDCLEIVRDFSGLTFLMQLVII